ncbi:MAG: hypothetical protein J5I98_06590 [Phaeodactylibacter sp.]|nr:hypothetical protein [Phaeodactylibacter sp.]
MSASATLEQQTIPDSLVYEMADGNPIIGEVRINIRQHIDNAPFKK